ncbi:MAG: trehalose-phosphatase [Candidatus Omnitrophica bacterium]|nr:trehalose-phosphatase [Candidatus Omnitrophota bacterium]
MGRNIPRGAKKNLKLILDKIKKKRKIFLFLDYDGTLTPIRKKPRLAKISTRTRKLLNKISKKKWAGVFIVSGRSIKNLRSLIRLKSICYIGNHGFEMEGPSVRYLHPAGRKAKPIMKKLYGILKKEILIKGIVFDDKEYTLSLHYRMVRKSERLKVKEKFKKVISGFNKNYPIKITHGKKVFEIRPRVAWDKGKIVKKVMRNKKNILPISIGDDITDEDMFRAVGKRGITIIVSAKKKKSFAQYRVSSTSEVVKFLKLFLNTEN